MATRLRLDADAEAKLQQLGNKFVADRVLPQVADAAKRIVPVDTGDLQDSIHPEVSADGMFVVADSEYAAFVENGTSKQAAQPYLRPALNTKIKG
jgi:HK97 gp10 family phage protein